MRTANGPPASMAQATPGPATIAPAIPLANVKAVQRMLGHASAAMTLDVYADLFDDDLDAVADALDAAVQLSVASRSSRN